MTGGQTMTRTKRREDAPKLTRGERVELDKLEGMERKGWRLGFADEARADWLRWKRDGGQQPLFGNWPKGGGR
jgi:hypothetical protein